MFWHTKWNLFTVINFVIPSKYWGGRGGGYMIFFFCFFFLYMFWCFVYHCNSRAKVISQQHFSVKQLSYSHWSAWRWFNYVWCAQNFPWLTVAIINPSTCSSWSNCPFSSKRPRIHLACGLIDNSPIPCVKALSLGPFLCWLRAMAPAPSWEKGQVLVFHITYCLHPWGKYDQVFPKTEREGFLTIS